MDESETNIRMAVGDSSGQAKSTSTDHHADGTSSRFANNKASLAEEAAPVCSLSDVWPEGEDVRPVRVLPANKGDVHKSGMPKPDRRRSVLKGMGGVKNA